MPVPSAVIFYQENTLYIEVDGLQDQLNPGTYLNTATVTATLYDSTGIASVPEVNALALAYQAASNGKFLGIVNGTFNPPVGGSYKLKIVANQGSIKLSLTIRALVEVRTS